MKHIKKFVEEVKIEILNESNETLDPVESMEVRTMEWDNDEDFGRTKTLIVKTKSGKTYKAKLSSDDDYDDGPDL